MSFRTFFLHLTLNVIFFNANEDSINELNLNEQ
jgi:hypothetical protein